MSSEVVVDYKRISGDEHQLTMNAKGLPEIKIDRKGIAKEELSNDHYGARLLCAAALSCFTNTFGNALIRNGADVKNMTAKATIEKDKDEVMRTKFTSMLLEVDVELDEADAPVFEKVKENMMAGSLVTYSLEDAIEMEYEITMNGE